MGEGGNPRFPWRGKVFFNNLSLVPRNILDIPNIFVTFPGNIIPKKYNSPESWFPRMEKDSIYQTPPKDDNHSFEHKKS